MSALYKIFVDGEPVKVSEERDAGTLKEVADKLETLDIYTNVILWREKDES